MVFRVDNCAETGVSLRYDGHLHTIRNAAGTWDLRLELEQLGAGEVVGVGSVTTSLDAPHDGVTARLIASGRIGSDRTGLLELTPLAAGGQSVIVLSVRFAPLIDEQEPVVSEVLAVRGLPA
jgi:hypothetical protein